MYGMYHVYSRFNVIFLSSSPSFVRGRKKKQKNWKEKIGTGIMKRRTSFGFVALLMAFVLIATMRMQHENLKINFRTSHLAGQQERWKRGLGGLPRGIVQDTSDLELKPLWDQARSKNDNSDNCNALLAMAVGISQKQNVHDIVSKFMNENCSVILFHYDGNVDGWRDLEWSYKVIHVVAHNQTKWWFAKRFLHPDVVSTYDYIFLWDEDLGVENFNPRRYLNIMLSEGLEISQPALDPNKSSEIHHQITVRKKMKRVHRRVYTLRASLNCSSESKGPPCTGWVEGMAPVFSQVAWRCVWHLIQNDLIHGWGLDMKMGYCAQGDRTKKVGVIDSEFIVHQGIPTLGGPSDKTPRRTLDLRALIRRQSTSELAKFKERWNKAVKEDARWTDPYKDVSHTQVKLISPN